jgi:hypothetical protein
MRNLLCMIGRHGWRVEHAKEGRPYKICGRPRCYRFRRRDDDIPSDGSHTRNDRGLPPPAPTPPSTGPTSPDGEACFDE